MSTETLDLMRDEFQRIKLLTDNTEIIGLCDRAMSNITQRVPVIRQRDDALATLSLTQSKLAAMEGVLRMDALWCFDNAEPPSELEARWYNGTGSLTSGPNNCRNFYEARRAVLDTAQASREGESR